MKATTGSASNPFLYAGQFRDSESSLYYLRARYYDPSTGQFISRDPKLPKTGTPYAYVADNPLNGADPTGLDGADILGAPFDGGTPGEDGGGGGGVSGLINGFVNAVYADFTAAVSLLCPFPPSFVNGVVAGFNFDVTSNGDAWFKAGQIVGALVSVGLMLSGPEDPLADADYARVVARGGEKGAQVLLDSNAVVRSADARALLSDREVGVVSSVSGPELRNAVATGSLKGVPAALGTFERIDDVMDINLRINIRGAVEALGSDRGLFGDGVIGATAVTRSLPVITYDEDLAAVLESYGVEVRP